MQRQEQSQEPDSRGLHSRSIDRGRYDAELVGHSGDDRGGQAGLETARRARRAGTVEGFRLDEAQRSDLELLGQQLFAGQRAAGFRYPVLEQRYDFASGPASLRLSRPFPVESVSQSRRPLDREYADRHPPREARHLCGGRLDRPHHALEVGVPKRAHFGPRNDVRSVERRSSAEPLEPAGKSQGDIRLWSGEFGRRGNVRVRRGQADGELVDPLERLDVDAVGRQGRGRRQSWQRRVPADRSGARFVYLQQMTALHPNREDLHDRTLRFRTEGSDMNARMMRVGRQELWVAVKPGTKDRPPLLLFNGIGANLELAEPFMRAMDERECVIFDIPGVGGSPPPALPYRPSTIARWAAGIVEQLGYQTVDVAGVSWGGGAAQQFAHQYPKICRKLVLAATSPGAIMVPGSPSVLWKMATPRRYLDREFMRRIAPEIYGGGFRHKPELVDALAEAMSGASQIGYAYQILAMAGWTSLPWLWTLKQPTLILAGRDDPIVPLANGRLMARMIPNSRLEILEDGHLFMVSRPVETAAIVETFLDE